VVRGERDTQEYDCVVDQKGISTRNSTVEVCAHEVLNVNLLKDMQVREGEDAVDADNVSAVHVRKPPHLVHVLLAKRHNKRGVRDEVQREHYTRPHLANHVNEEGEAKHGREAKSGDQNVSNVSKRSWDCAAALTNY
jgi:hypothetical protein